MANQFLVEIHDHVSRQIDAGARDRADAQSRQDSDRIAFMDGKLDELRKVRRFLTEHFDLTTQKYY